VPIRKNPWFGGRGCGSWRGPGSAGRRRIETRTGHRIEKFIALDIGGPGPMAGRGGSTFRLARNMPEARRQWLGEVLGAMLERER
jgi:hypothetical protein